MQTKYTREAGKCILGLAAVCWRGIVLVMKANIRPSVADIARMFRCSVDQVNALRAKNRAQLTVMYNEACRTGKRVNGYTSEQLRQVINGLPIS